MGLRIVITKHEHEVTRTSPLGEVTTSTIVEHKYQLAFEGRIICAEVDSRNLMAVFFAAYMFAALTKCVVRWRVNCYVFVALRSLLNLVL